MNSLVRKYLNENGVKDYPDMPDDEREKLRNRDDVVYVIGADLQGWFVTIKPPKNDREDLILDYINEMPNY